MVAASARCIRTWGDGGIYARQLWYDIEAQITTVLDGRRGKWIYHWNQLGLVTAQIDPLGHVTTTEFNDTATESRKSMRWVPPSPSSTTMPVAW